MCAPAVVVLHRPQAAAAGSACRISLILRIFIILAGSRYLYFPRFIHFSRKYYFQSVWHPPILGIFLFPFPFSVGHETNQAAQNIFVNTNGTEPATNTHPPTTNDQPKNLTLVKIAYFRGQCFPQARAPRCPHLPQSRPQPPTIIQQLLSPTGVGSPTIASSARVRGAGETIPNPRLFHRCPDFHNHELQL